MAPNIFYLGNAGVVKYGGLRIAGLSGIYKEPHYELSESILLASRSTLLEHLRTL